MYIGNRERWLRTIRKLLFNISITNKFQFDPTPIAPAAGAAGAAAQPPTRSETIKVLTKGSGTDPKFPIIIGSIFDKFTNNFEP